LTVNSYYEAMMKHEVLLLDMHRIRAGSELEQLRKLDRLQRSVQAIRARLRLGPVAFE
jgi:hypothetical protein